MKPGSEKDFGFVTAQIMLNVADDNGEDDLPIHVVRSGRGGDGHAEGGEVKGESFNLEARAVHDAHGVIAAPLQTDEREESERDGKELLTG